MNGLQYKKLIKNDQGADILVVAGDISDGTYYEVGHVKDVYAEEHRQDKKAGVDFIDYAGKNWKEVFIVYGNHDFFYGELPTHYFGHTKDIGSLRFISTPLFSLLDQKMESDPRTYRFPDLRIIYRHGVPIGCSEYNGYATQCRAWLEKQLKALPENMKAVVCTHHLPMTGIVKENLRGSNFQFFANDLTDLLNRYNKQIVLWIHGHHHFPSDVTLAGVRIVGNPIGYISHGEGQNHETKVIEIHHENTVRIGSTSRSRHQPGKTSRTIVQRVRS
jgi:DNA repair exonuclease SbcCD nuclease subunit